MRYLKQVNCDRLLHALINTHENEWAQDKFRQTAFSNVHSETQSILIIFIEGVWPNVCIRRKSGWGRFGEIVSEIITEILSKNYPPNGRILRAVLAKLPAGAKIGRHRDADESFSVSHRIHVPIITNDYVDFIVGNTRLEPKPGLAFELNNDLPHMVVNRGATDRIHLIFDYMPAMPLQPGKVDRNG